MDLNPQGLDVVGSVGTTCEVRQVELDLIPSIIESHRHSTDEGLHSGRGLVVGGTESTSYILVIKNLNFEGEVFLQVLDDHDEERQLDTKGLLLVSRAGDVGGAYIGAYNLQHKGLNVVICYPFYVSIANLLVPDLEGLTTNTVKYGEESGLESVLEHFTSIKI